MAYEHIRIENEGPVRIITVHRPHVMNAMNRATVRELSAAFEEIDASHDVRAAILTGAGEKAFIAGADIGEFNALGPEDARAYAEFGHRILDRIAALRVPVIVAANGFTLGGGLEIALACDFIYASDNARLGLVELNLGVIPGFGGTARLCRRVGKAMAMELILSAAQVKADEALRIGLVNKVFPQSELMAEAKKTAAAIAAKSPLTVAAIKRLLREGENTDLRVANSLEEHSFGLIFSSKDRIEGVNAFMEKRKATFEGK